MSDSWQDACSHLDVTIDQYLRQYGATAGKIRAEESAQEFARDGYPALAEHYAAVARELAR